jgi:hypothetical protein
LQHKTKLTVNTGAQVNLAESVWRAFSPAQLGSLELVLIIGRGRLSTTLRQWPNLFCKNLQEPVIAPPPLEFVLLKPQQDGCFDARAEPDRKGYFTYFIPTVKWPLTLRDISQQEFLNCEDIIIKWNIEA